MLFLVNAISLMELAIVLIVTLIMSLLAVIGFVRFMTTNRKCRNNQLTTCCDTFCRLICEGDDDDDSSLDEIINDCQDTGDSGEENLSCNVDDEDVDTDYSEDYDDEEEDNEETDSEEDTEFTDEEEENDKERENQCIIHSPIIATGGIGRYLMDRDSLSTIMCDIEQAVDRKDLNMGNNARVTGGGGGGGGGGHEVNNDTEEFEVNEDVNKLKKQRDKDEVMKCQVEFHPSNSNTVMEMMMEDDDDKTIEIIDERTNISMRESLL